MQLNGQQSNTRSDPKCQEGMSIKLQMEIAAGRAGGGGACVNSQLAD
jgi:hypothetical protein